MLDLKDAVEAARVFAKRLFAEAEIRQMRVEEVEYDIPGDKWLVTLGWPEPDLRQINRVLGSSHSSVVAAPRVYKQFVVDAMGHVTSTKIRKI